MFVLERAGVGLGDLVDHSQRHAGACCSDEAVDVFCEKAVDRGVGHFTVVTRVARKPLDVCAELAKKMRDSLRSFRETGSRQAARQYSFERSAFHKAARQAEMRRNVQEVEELVENAHSRGISTLYRHARVASDIATTNLPVFLQYCKSLFISPCTPVLHRIYDPEEHV